MYDFSIIVHMMCCYSLLCVVKYVETIRFFTLQTIIFKSFNSIFSFLCPSFHTAVSAKFLTGSHTTKNININMQCFPRNSDTINLDNLLTSLSTVFIGTLFSVDSNSSGNTMRIVLPCEIFLVIFFASSSVLQEPKTKFHSLTLYEG